jgi:pimeloyl-ACP methyl ester carboxylesterase
MRKPARLVVGAVAIVAAVGVAWRSWKAYRFERELVFARHTLGDATAAGSGLPGAIDVEYGRCDGSPLHGWYAPGRNGAAILFVHGAGADRRALAPEAILLRGEGYGVLLIDLPGLGGSGGRITGGPNEERAIESAVEWLAGQRGVTRIGGFAHSMGSHFLTRVAARDQRIRAVVLEAPSTSIIDRIRTTQGRSAWWTALPASLAFIQAGTNPWQRQARDAMPALAGRPVLLITGERDVMATPAMGRELAARAGPSARLELFQTGHAGYWEADPQRYPKLLVDFFRTALLAP